MPIDLKLSKHYSNQYQFDIEIVYEDVKTFDIETGVSGMTFIFPLKTSPNAIARIVNQHAPLNKKQYARKKTLLNDNKKISTLVGKWAKVMGTSNPRIVLEDTLIRWGAYREDGLLLLSEILQYVPTPMLECIVVHELSHKVHAEALIEQYGRLPQSWRTDPHSDDFFDILYDYMPDYDLKLNSLIRFVRDTLKYTVGNYM